MRKSSVFVVEIDKYVMADMEILRSENTGNAGDRWRLLFSGVINFRKQAIYLFFVLYDVTFHQVVEILTLAGSKRLKEVEISLR